MDFLRTYKLEIAIFVLALVVRLVYFGASISANDGNLIGAAAGSDCYYLISKNLVEGHGYSCEPQEPYTLNSIRPPMQPYFLAAAHSLAGSYWSPLLIQIVLGSVIPLLAMLIARLVFASRFVIYGTGVALALEPYGVLFSTFFYSETLFTVFLLSAVYAFLRYFKEPHWRWLAGSGAGLGLATLTKPTAEYLGVLFIVILAWHFRHSFRRHLPAMCAFVLAFVLVLLPWVYRNQVHFGVAGVSPQLGEQLNAVLVPSVLSFERGTTFDEEFQAMIDRGGADPNKATIADSSKYLAQAIPILLDHPKGLVLVSLNTALNFFIHDGMIEVLRHIDAFPKERLGKPALFILLSDPGAFVGHVQKFIFTPAVLVMVGRVVWIIITVAMLMGLWRYYRGHGLVPGFLTPAAVITYFMLTTLVIGLAVAARYRLPINGIIFMFALYELQAWWKRWRP